MIINGYEVTYWKDQQEYQLDELPHKYNTLGVEEFIKRMRKDKLGKQGILSFMEDGQWVALVTPL